MQKAKSREALLEKANDLPLTPGVYLMEDRNGKVIYIGKSRKLRNRVSQYFRNGEKKCQNRPDGLYGRGFPLLSL